MTDYSIHPSRDPDAIPASQATPAELEARRREIVYDLTHKYRGYNDPEVPLILLQELAIITSTLRRKNAGPPRAKPTRKPQATLDDIV